MGKINQEFEEFKQKSTKSGYPIIDKHGTQFCYNVQGELHNDIGPALIDINGYKAWYKNGLLHNENGPAIIWPDGSKYWYQNGRIHNGKGPAIIFANGENFWYVNGKKLTEAEFNEYKKPESKNPVMDKNGNKYWYKHGTRHNDFGPAIIYKNGDKEWFKHGKQYTEEKFNEYQIKKNDNCLYNKNGKLLYEKSVDGIQYWYDVNGEYHNEDGPAIIYKNGDKEWFKHGLRHNENGLSVIWADGERCWHINGVLLSKKEFRTLKRYNKKLKKKDLKYLLISMN